MGHSLTHLAAATIKKKLWNSRKRFSFFVPAEITEKVFVIGAKKLPPTFGPRTIAASLYRRLNHAESRLPPSC